MITPSWPAFWPAGSILSTLHAHSLVDAVARAEIDAQLAQAFTDWADIAGVPIGQTFDTRLDLPPALRISNASVRFTSSIDPLHAIGGAM